MIHVKYILALIPLYLCLIVLFIRIERRLSILETHVSWIKKRLNKINGYPLDERRKL